MSWEIDALSAQPAWLLPAIGMLAALAGYGLLAGPDSPLTKLLPEVWAQVGGLDRARPHALQLRIASEFCSVTSNTLEPKPFIRFGNVSLTAFGCNRQGDQTEGLCPGGEFPGVFARSGKP